MTYPWWTIGLIVFLLAGPFVLNFVLRWVVAPVLIRSRQRLAVRPTHELTRAEQLTPEMQQFIGRAVRQFAAEGFEVAANFHQPDGVTNAGGVPTVRAVQVLLVNRATSDTALIIVDWNLEAMSPDGTGISPTGTTTAVARRSADGSWRFAILNCQGAAGSPGWS